MAPADCLDRREPPEGEEVRWRGHADIREKQDVERLGGDRLTLGSQPARQDHRLGTGLVQGVAERVTLRAGRMQGDYLEPCMVELLDQTTIKFANRVLAEE